LVQYGRFALITNSASSVFRTTDHFMVSAILSTAAVAPLSLCVRLINIIDIPSQVLSEVLFVRTAQQTAGGDHNKAAATFEFAVGSALALVLPAVLVLCLFPSFFLLVIGGEKYMEYGWLLQLVCATALVMPFMRQFGTITDAAGLPALNASVMCVLMLLNMVACYLGISLLGLAGAPVAVFSAQVLVLMVILVIAKRRFGVSFARIWRSFIGCYALMWDKLIVHQLSRIRRKNNLI
jgi:O-antigen/teichoic acid export membrane protein